MNSPITQQLEADQGVEASCEKRLTDPRPIFLAMQGGGAKGVAHVGALTAIEGFEYDIRGVSGTSAGSMVAALVAAGYKARELVNLETKEHLFSEASQALGFHQPTDIFPGTGWRNLKIAQYCLPKLGFCLGFRADKESHAKEPKLGTEQARARDARKLDANKRARGQLERELSAASAERCAKRRPVPVTRIGKLMASAATWMSHGLEALGLSVRASANLTWFAVFNFLPFTAVALFLKWAYQVAPAWTVVVVSALLVAGVSLIIKLLRYGWQAVGGLNTVGNVSLLIDRAIAKKLREAGYPNEGGITFADLKRARLVAGTIPLKIVATNVAYESLELFSEDRTPDVKVGDAVAASVCLPVVFEPWNLTFYRHTETLTELIEGQFLDGGLVSNLPAWPFDEERVLSPEIGTIALSLESEVKIGKHWTSAVVGTVVNGSSMIHTRAAGSTLKISLSPKMKMMQFDASAQSVLDVVSATEKAVSFRLSEELRTRTALHDAAAALHQRIDKRLQQSSMAGWFQPATKPRMRLAIIAERGGSMNSLSTVASHGYKPGDIDRAITRHADCWIFKKALQSKKPQFYPFKTRTSGDALYNGERIWPRARWLVCFPIPLPELPSEIPQRRGRRCVVVVDSNIPVDTSNPLINEFLGLFLSLSYAEVLQYFESNDLMDSVQGDNTWI